MADALPKAFQDESFAFNGKILNGVPQQEARWMRVQTATDRALGEALGQLYVRRTFSPEAKAKMIVLVGNLRAALKAADREARLDGPGNQGAGAQASSPPSASRSAIPTSGATTRRSTITRASYAENLLRAQKFEAARNLAKLGKPIDRTEWGMTPPTVNAYYSPTMNEIVFPAGHPAAAVLRPEGGRRGQLRRDRRGHRPRDEARLRRQGSQFDADGNLKNWWTEADRAAFKAHTDKLVQQFDGFEALPGEHVNGRLTLGENIGDLGGLTIAYAALEKALAGKPRPAPIDGFTPEQRFFLSWAQIWRQTIRPEAQRVRLATDPHSPGQFRVDGPLGNMPEFFKAFGCAPGSPMVRPADVRTSIW